MTSLELWPIGNCQVSALIDRKGDYVWGCVPRVDGDPLFSSLLGGDHSAHGFWAIELEGCRTVEQSYERNTPILKTRKTDENGNSIEIIDFCPRFRRLGRAYRPVAFVRIVRPLEGSPRISVKLRPTANWGQPCEASAGGSNHLRFAGSTMKLRLTTDAPVGLVSEEHSFALSRLRSYCDC